MIKKALKPVPFKEANCELTPRMYSPKHKGLRVWADGETCISCWKMTLRQRLSALIFGKVWLGINSGGYSMPGTWLICGRTCLVKAKKKKAEGGKKHGR